MFKQLKALVEKIPSDGGCRSLIEYQLTVSQMYKC